MALIRPLPISLALSCWALSAQAPPEAVAVLKSSCLACHNQQNRSSGLAMDTRDSLVQGGNRGPAAKAGAPDDSLLIQAVEQKGALKMPPGGKLKDEQIA